MFNYKVSDYIVGVQNCIEAGGIAPGEQVLLVGDHRSDPLTIEALEVGLTAFGAFPSTLITEQARRYSGVSKVVLDAMAAADTVIWVWPVFLTFVDEYRHRPVQQIREREENLAPGTAKGKPYYIYFEGTPGLMATDYARFPNELMFKIAEKLRAEVQDGEILRIEGGSGTKLETTYAGHKLYGMQFAPGDPPGRCHFPWGRCGIFNGEGSANGIVYINCIQGVPGQLPEPMGWRLEDNVLVEVIGGGEAGDHTRAQLREHPELARLNEIMFGYHPKASVSRGIDDVMHWELISKMPWAGIGTPRGHEPFRHIDGAMLNTRLYIDDKLILDEFGRLQLLQSDEEIRELAAKFGDPERVLAAVNHEGGGSGAVW